MTCMTETNSITKAVVGVDNLIAAPSPYGLRKRKAVNYTEVNNDDDELMQDAWSDAEKDDEDARPKKKSKTTPRPSKPLSKREIFPFLSLPGELRNKIYSYTLCDPSGVYLAAHTFNYRRVAVRFDPAVEDISSSWSRSQQDRWNRNRRAVSDDSMSDEVRNPPVMVTFVPALLSLNKLVYAEAKSVLYENQFFFADTTAMHHFLANLGPSHRASLKDLTLLGWGVGRGTHKAMNYPALTLLSDATSLKTFRFDCRVGWGYGTPRYKWLARQVMRDGHVWLESWKRREGVEKVLEGLEVAEENFEEMRTWRRPVTENISTERALEGFRAELKKRLES